nr:MAG TPA: IcmR, IcmQ heterodimer, ADPRT-like fold, NAD-binding.4A [Caudoviricetes sp.]
MNSRNRIGFYAPPVKPEGLFFDLYTFAFNY